VLAKDVVRAYEGEEVKDTKVVSEVVYLAPVLEKRQLSAHIEGNFPRN
jgi:hypothetical protein